MNELRSNLQQVILKARAALETPIDFVDLERRGVLAPATKRFRYADQRHRPVEHRMSLSRQSALRHIRVDTAVRGGHSKHAGRADTSRRP